MGGVYRLYGKLLQDHPAQNLQTGGGNQVQQDQAEPGPESIARQRQFEETLKSFELRAPGSQQQDQNRNKSAQQGTTGRRLPIPLRYRERYEAFTRSLSRQRQQQQKPR